MDDMAAICESVKKKSHLGYLAFCFVLPNNLPLSMLCDSYWPVIKSQ